VTPRFRSALAILTALLFALPLAFTASAQDLDATAGKLAIEDLDGVETAISRTYATDIAAIVETASGTPTGDEDSGGPILMLAVAAEFDSADHAADAARTIRDRLTTRDPDNLNGIEMEAAEVENLGDTAWTVSATRDSGSSPVSIDGVLVQDADWLYLSIAISDDGSSSDAARAIVDFSLQHNADTSQAIYDHTGLSHGGVWEKLPSGDNTMSLSGTRPIFDNQLLPPSPPED